MKEGKLIFLIMIDGTNYEVFNTLLREGRLPNFSTLLKEKDGCFKKSLSTFPSTTAPAIPEILMGQYSFRFSGLPKAIHAFDRESLEIKRYEFLLDEWGKRNLRLLHMFKEKGWTILSFFKAHIRDSHYTYYNEILYQLEFISDFTGLRWINYDEVQMVKLQDFLTRNPEPDKLIFIVLNSADLNGHLFGPFSDEYVESLIKIDELIGNLVAFLKKEKYNGKPLFDLSSFVIFGDHGISPSGNHIPMERILRGYGLSTFDAGNPLALITENLMGILEKDVDLLLFPAGSNIADLYVRNIVNGEPQPWNSLAPGELLRNYPNRSKPLFMYDLKNLITSIGAIDFILMKKDKDIVEVYGYGDTRGIIYRKWEGKKPLFLYQVPYGKDPLGYIDDKMIREHIWIGTEVNETNFREPVFAHFFHDEQTWINLTWEHSHPGGPPLLSKAFDRDVTTSDIVLTAKEHFSFMRMVKGDHGAMIPSSMFTILFILGNGISCRDNVHPRILDIFNAVARLGKIEFSPEETDGVDII